MAGTVKGKEAARSSPSLTPGILQHVDFQALTPILRTVGQLIAEDCTQKEIARILGVTEQAVANMVGELREALLEQVRARARELEEGVRARLAEARSSTARAAGGAASSKPRTGSPGGPSQRAA